MKYSHKGALAFVDWCSETFKPNENDRFSSHAPFHFDLSIHDIYVSLKHGATLVLIDEETGKQPMTLAPLISEKQISIWYSTPSILTLLLKFGKLEKLDHSKLRIVHFAGEVFPIKHLRALKEIWTGKRYFNLYGPTETNVCTYYEIPDKIPDDKTTPFPIGKDCSHLTCKVFNDEGELVPKLSEGELCVTGPIMQGYWNLPERNEAVFFKDKNGTKWYKTGDVVIEEEDGNYTYVSRKDRMVKRRGYRVELGEIETALYKHPAVLEAAAITGTDKDGGVLVKAFLVMNDTAEESMIKMKQFSSDNLPQYMIPDRFSFQKSLPKTSTNKIDYQKLKEY
ncbi:MAG: AMP-binding protein [Ignavibacteriales bacterium]|nr:AMP-binding protein [Ignavibacteriales bacterium]